MLNKKRLAALGLSAVMVASTASLPVSAADFSDGGISAQSEVADESTEVEVNDNAQDAVGERTVWTDWDYTNKIFKYAYTDNGAEPDPAIIHTVDAEWVVTTHALCDGTKNSGIRHLEPVAGAEIPEDIPKEKLKSGDQPYTIDAAEKAIHDATKRRTTEEVTVQGSCKEGTPTTKVVKTLCGVCDRVISQEEYTEATPHNFDESKTTTEYQTKEEWNTKIGSDGKPVVIDNAKKGTYKERKKQYCITCENWIVGDWSEDKEIGAEATVVKEQTVVDVHNIYSFKENDKYENVPEKDKIVLADDSKSGSYRIKTIYEGKENAPVYSDVITIEAGHHVEAKAEVKAVNKEDEGLVRGEYDKNGKLINVVNNSCAKDVPYTVTIKCQSPVCSLENKIIKTYTDTAPKSTKHSPYKDIKNAVDTAKNTGTALTTEKIAEFDAAPAKVKVIPEKATCYKAGTVTVVIYCEVCGKEAAKITGVPAQKLPHKYVYSKENIVNATCTQKGSYEQVIKCERCKDEIDRYLVSGERLPHTNEDNNRVDVTTADKGSDVIVQFTGKLVRGKYNVGDLADGTIGKTGKEDGGKVTARVYTDCAVCHNHTVLLQKTPVITVTSVKPETYDKLTGVLTSVGTIGLKATYTRDDETVVTVETNLPYVSDENLVIPDKFKAGLEKDKDGVFRYYVNGEFDSTFNGFAEYDGEKFFVKDGIVENKTGLKLFEDKWYNLSMGRLTMEYTGAVLYDGAWFYVSNGVMDVEKSGLADYNGGTFLFTDGRLRYDVNGLWMDPTTGIWYFLANGQVQTQYTGVAMYDGAFFYIQGGQLAKNYKGTVNYEGAKFNVVDGQLYGPIK